MMPPSPMPCRVLPKPYSDFSKHRENFSPYARYQFAKPSALLFTETEGLMDTRKPVFAGSWYPAAAAECENLIKEFQNDSRFHVDPDPAYKGGIVPHAGWVFSGSLACNVIAAMQPQKPGEGPDTVVIFGMHLPPNTPGTIMAEGTWDTPFGEIEIDADLAEGLCRDY